MEQIQMGNRKVQGFTLIELMIVMVIIGVLAAIAIPKFSRVSERAKQAEAETILKQIYSFEYMHRERVGAFTTDLSPTGLGRLGWEVPRAQYFTFSVPTVTATEFCVDATPTVVMVKQRSMKGNRATGATDDGALYDALGCTGNRVD